MKGARAVVVCLTGGGTAGHVTPHFALLPGMQKRGWRPFYIGSSGIEKSLVEGQGIPFHAIATGKLRRYFSLKNFLDIFKVGFGCVQALSVLLRMRPDVVFSKGGFVAVPVAAAAWLLRIPVVSHESDYTPGLATKIIAKFARIVYTFPDTKKYLPATAVQVGTPIREELFRGDKAKGLKFCGFDSAETIPTYLFMGGSQGAQRINESLREMLPDLVKEARVIHLAGAGKLLDFQNPRYKGFEFVKDELKDLFAAADFVVSRSGANSIFELLAVNKPMLLIPLEIGSRGDQVVNAASFEKNGWAMILRETELNAETLRSAMKGLASRAETMRAKQREYSSREASERVLGVLAEVMK